MKADSGVIQWGIDLAQYLWGLLKSLASISFMFFMPAKLMILVVVIVGALDTYFGIKRSKKDGKPFSSKSFRLGFIINKVIIFSIAILLSFMLDRVALDELIKYITGIPIDNLVTKLVTVAIVWNETRSIDESWVVLKGYSFIDRMKDFIIKAINFRKKIKEDGI